jgi:predicted house-cleaning noncanonical NTP pyrophosphatase (MazG superfamily)
MKKVFNKLVRDKMIDVWEYDIANKISASGYSAHYVTKDETLVLLKDKLLEEAHEVFEAYDKEDKKHLVEELADVIEVIDGILYHNNITLSEVLAIRDAKKEKKGGFEKGLYLESVDYFD